MATRNTSDRGGGWFAFWTRWRRRSGVTARATFVQRFLSRGDLGRLGERLAARHLRQAGYRVVARNVRMQHGELDLVARKGAEMVIAEVRTRRAGGPQSPEASVDRTKRRHLVSAAEEFVRRRRIREVFIRFDVFAIEVADDWTVTRLDHFERAFDPPR